MGNKLFVGNLSWGISSQGLQEAFEPFGPITDAVVISDRDTGRSRGFGFVTFENDDDAESAMKEMDGKDLDGRAIRVNEAHEKKPRNNRGF